MPEPHPGRTLVCRSPVTEGPGSILLSRLHERTLHDAVSAEAEMRASHTQSCAAPGRTIIQVDSASDADRSLVELAAGVRATDVCDGAKLVAPSHPRPDDQGCCCDCMGGPINRNDTSMSMPRGTAAAGATEVTLPRATAEAGATQLSPRKQFGNFRLRRDSALRDERAASRAELARTSLRDDPVAATSPPCPSLHEREPRSFVRQQDPSLHRPWWSCWGTF